jgi:hypothetical protein
MLRSKVPTKNKQKIMKAKSKQFRKERDLLLREMKRRANDRRVHCVFPGLKDPLEWLEPTPPEDSVFPCAFWDYYEELFDDGPIGPLGPV